MILQQISAPQNQVQNNQQRMDHLRKYLEIIHSPLGQRIIFMSAHTHTHLLIMIIFYKFPIYY